MTPEPAATPAPSDEPTALAQAEERNRLLLIEMQHRVKNSLAVVQAIAMQTLRRAKDTESAADILGGRISALAAAHDLLSPERWADSTLDVVVARAIAPHDDGRDRFEISGPPVTLAVRPALSLWLALHELGTNAIKFGALSTETGRIAITWQMDETAGTLSLDWRERDGPAVEAPAAKGFGTRLIQDALGAEWGGKVVLDYAPGGFSAAITGKLARVLAKG